MKTYKLVLAVTLIGSLGAGLVACSTPGSVSMHGSRSELYDSVRAIAADSTIVAVVEVEDQKVTEPATDQDIPYTLSTATVIIGFTPAGIGSELPKGTVASGESQVVVRQMGSDGDDIPYPILKPGEQYLLFLTPSMLEGDAAAQYYVTGGSAGIYNADGDVFTHGPFDEGDKLPDTLTAKDLAP